MYPLDTTSSSRLVGRARRQPWWSSYSWDGTLAPDPEPGNAEGRTASRRRPSRSPAGPHPSGPASRVLALDARRHLRVAHAHLVQLGDQLRVARSDQGERTAGDV